MSASRVSAALWIPIVWYALETSQSVSRWLTIFGYQVAAPDAIDGSPIDRLIYSVLLLVAIGILLARKTKWRSILDSNRWLCVLFLYMLVSVIWSDYPLISFKRWIRAMVDVLMALVVLTDRGAFEAECTVIRRVMFINIPLSIILIKYFRNISTVWDESGLEIWNGATPQKNVLGQVVMVAAIYFLFELIRNVRNRRVFLYFAFFMMTAWLLKGSPSYRSNTSILGFAIGASLMFGLRTLKPRMVYIQRHLGAVVLVLALLFAAFQVLQAAGGVSFVAAGIEASGRDATLTGRTDLWNDLLAIASERPMLGVGFGAFWVGNTHNLWAVHLWGPTQGHNGYLDVYLEIGAIGVVLLVCVIIASFRSTVALLVENFEQGMLHFIWLCIIVCHNFTESSYLRGSVDLWFLFVLAAITVPPCVPALNVASVDVKSRMRAISVNPRFNPSGRRGAA
jgi:exopolysaccharide production protein ExoQ